MPTMTNPNPGIGSAVLDNAPDGSALFRALGGHYTSPAQAVCEFIDDSLSSIAANGDEVGEVFLRVTDCGEYVELSVTDSGSGIKEEDQAKLFQAFSPSTCTAHTSCVS